MVRTDFEKTIRSELFLFTQKEFSDVVIVNTKKFIKTNHINLNCANLGTLSFNANRYKYNSWKR